MAGIRLTRLRILSKRIGARLSMIYHQLRSGKKERRRNICMSLMISKKLLRLIGTFDYYVHISPILEKTRKRSEKHEESSCAHNKHLGQCLELGSEAIQSRQLVLHFIFSLQGRFEPPGKLRYLTYSVLLRYILWVRTKVL